LAPPPLEVDLTAIVTDSRNQHILDLRREDFRMTEDGIPQEITHFSRETVPVHVALVIDTSGSMKRSISEVQKAASHFISGLQPRDQIVLMEFSDDVNVLHDFSSDSRTLIAAVMKIKALRGTALYDAVITPGVSGSSQ
jgi:VWFA-related protein